jgi:membrane protease YdiL (CAAX protease family)
MNTVHGTGIAIRMCIAVHMVCIVASVLRPASRYYFLLRKAGFLAGLAAVTLSFNAGLVLMNVSKPALWIALACAQLSMLVSLVTANYSWRQGLRLFADVYKVIEFSAGLWMAAVLTLLAAVYEEIIWRLNFLGYFRNAWIGVAAGSVLFYICHIPRSGKTRIPRMLDLCCFSFLNCWLYLVTNSLVAVVIVHWLRNWLLANLRGHMDEPYRKSLKATLQRARSAVARRAEDAAPASPKREHWLTL